MTWLLIDGWPFAVTETSAGQAHPHPCARPVEHDPGGTCP